MQTIAANVRSQKGPTNKRARTACGERPTQPESQDTLVRGKRCAPLAIGSPSTEQGRGRGRGVADPPAGRAHAVTLPVRYAVRTRCVSGREKGEHRCGLLYEKRRGSRRLVRHAYMAGVWQRGVYPYTGRGGYTGREGGECVHAGRGGYTGREGWHLRFGGAAAVLVVLVVVHPAARDGVEDLQTGRFGYWWGRVGWVAQRGHRSGAFPRPLPSSKHETPNTPCQL